MIPTVTIDDACDLVTDGTHYTPRDAGHGIPFLTVKDVTDHELDFLGCSFISEDDYEAARNGNSAPERGDILFSKDGTVGKVHVVNTDRPFAVLSSLAILRPRRGAVDPDYFGHVLRSPGVLSDAMKRKTGSALRRVILADLKKVTIPLPPLPEQLRIAKILDNADALRAKRRAALAELDTLTRVIFLDMFGDPARNPKAWPVSRMDDVAEIVSGATPRTDRPEYWNGAVNWVTPKELSDLQGISISQTERRITEAGLRSCAATVLPVGSVLFSSRAPIGHTAICGAPMATNQGFKSFIPKPERLDASYLLLWLRMRRSFLEGLGTGATFKEVSKAVVSRIEISVPPIALQKTFADRLRMQETLSCRGRKAMTLLDEQFTSIQYRAFRGEL